MNNSAVRALSYADVVSGRTLDRQTADSDVQNQTMNSEDGQSTSCETEEYEYTILDWLNDDHWRLILDYVHVKDIIRSERVSTRWQGVVHRYLQEVGICLALLEGYFAQRNVKMQPKNRIVETEDRYDQEIRIQFTEKWGPYMVYTYCTTRPELECIAQCCPKLKGLAIHIYRFGTGPLSQKQMELCEKLKQLALIDFTNYYDFKQFDDIEHYDEDVSRAFCANLNPTNLKSLTICCMFDYRHFLASIECFPKLIELNVQGGGTNIPLLLKKTPKLERLALLTTQIDPGSCDPTYKLDHLKHLTLFEFKGTKWLERLADNELQTLTCLCSMDGKKKLVENTSLKLILTRWRMLSEIQMAASYVLTDDDVVAIIKSCRHLMLLDVSSCKALTPKLLRRAARATRGRAAPLRLKIGDTKAAAAVDTFDQTQYPELIVDTQAPPPGEYVERRPFEYIEPQLC